MKVLIAIFVCVALLLAAATVKETSTAAGIKLTDVTAAAGIQFTHNSGRAGKKWLPETMGSGVRVLRRRRRRLARSPVHQRQGLDAARARESISALYRNNRNGTFTDITAGSGLDVEMYGMGVAVGRLRQRRARRRLHHRARRRPPVPQRRRRQVRATSPKPSGIAQRELSAPAPPGSITTATARLDLFVANYVQWTAKGDLWCSLDGATKSYCTPESLQGHAVEALSQPRRRQVRGRDGEGRSRRPDQQVAGRGRARFQRRRLAGPLRRQRHAAQQALPQQRQRHLHGRAAWRRAWPSARTAWRAAPWAPTPATMTAPAAPHLLVGNFSNQMLGLYHNEGNGLFVDEAPRSTVGRASLLSLAFGVFFFDLRPRRLARHLRRQRPHRRGDRPRAAQGPVTRQPPLLFRNLGKGKFEDVSRAQWAPSSSVRSWRAAPPTPISTTTAISTC